MYIEPKIMSYFSGAVSRRQPTRMLRLRANLKTLQRQYWMIKLQQYMLSVCQCVYSILQYFRWKLVCYRLVRMFICLSYLGHFLSFYTTDGKNTTWIFMYRFWVNFFCNVCLFFKRHTETTALYRSKGGIVGHYKLRRAIRTARDFSQQLRGRSHFDTLIKKCFVNRGPGVVVLPFQRMWRNTRQPYWWLWL